MTSAAVEAMLRDSRLDRKKTFATFRDLDGKKGAMSTVRRWAGECFPGTGILLRGPTGTGKSHLANAAGLHLIRRRGLFTFFLRTVEIPRHDTDAVMRLTDPDEFPVLILDDLGAEKMTERGVECLHLIIDGRLRVGAPMVVTTNDGKDDLSDKFDRGISESGPRLVGRLVEACRWVAVGGDDMRRK